MSKTLWWAQLGHLIAGRISSEPLGRLSKSMKTPLFFQHLKLWSPQGPPKTIDFAAAVCQNHVFGPPGPPQAHPPCFANIVFALVFTGSNRCGPKNRRLQVLQGAALSVFTVFVHVVFPLVFSGQTRPWAVQWLPQCMLTATADQLQDPSDTTSKHQ